MSRASEQGAIRLLILGGYGVFGGRLAQLLSDCSEIDMLIAGRDKARASAFCKAFVGAASVQPVQLDRADIAGALGAFQPDLVVDASGPFQDYGGEQYGVVDACIAHGCDYLDLADGAEFVRGIGRFDDAAKAADVVALSGVSSFPVLTAAVLRRLAEDMEVHEVEAGIAPSPYAGIGLNVMRAVVGYAGSPVPLMRGGEMTSAPGLAESRRATVAVPPSKGRTAVPWVSMRRV